MHRKMQKINYIIFKHKYRLILAATDDSIVSVKFNPNESDFLQLEKKFTLVNRENRLLKQLKKQIENYFRHKKIDFDLPFHVWWSSNKLFWKKLQNVPCGKLTTYGRLASLTNTFPRAVGSLLRSNRLQLILPCHRVVNTNGELGGFSSGVQIKHELINHEQALNE